MRGRPLSVHNADMSELSADAAHVKALFEDADWESVADALTLRPCHTTGEHTPNHHVTRTCPDQRSRMLEGILDALGVVEAELPRALHDDGCYWCHHVPSQETYRVDLRKSYAWAGVEIPAELAATARDGWHPGDDEAVLSALRVLCAGHGAQEWFGNPQVKAALDEQGRTDIGVERINIVTRKMKEHGLLEETVVGGVYRKRLTVAGRTA